MEERPVRPLSVSIWSPESARAAAVARDAATGHVTEVEMRRDGPRWRAELDAADGDHYWFVVDGVGPLVDPAAREVEMTAGGPLGVVRGEWPLRPRGTPLEHEPVVYELHVRGFGRTFRGVQERLPYLADLGVNVIELMPIHPFDDHGNYWGYMPIVWGAVHRPYGTVEELADLVEAAHDVGIHVWLDVVFNHTGEGDASMPTWTWRGLDDRHAYVHESDGRYNDDAGCGNVIDPGHAEIRRLVFDALQRFSDLGVDGFRFDLASVLTRDGGELVRAIGDWAAEEGVPLVAEAWDLARYQVGDAFPDARWLQWNDRFRDDVRGLLRGEPGMIAAVAQRVAGSPDLFAGAPWRSVNFVTAHDGLTLHDLTTVTSDRHRSWDTGPELRMQQLKNAFTILLLSAGTPMFVMGDEFARTQHGHDNPYDVDSELTWVDWTRLEEWRELQAFVRALLGLRRAHPVHEVRVYGTSGTLDRSDETRALAWATDRLYVAANLGWHPAEFAMQEQGPWELALATSSGAHVDCGRALQVPPRSIAVLARPAAT